MASQQIDIDDEQEAEATGPLTIPEILGADNIADLLTDDRLNKIGQDVIRDFEIDLESRKKEGWDKRNETAMKAAMQSRDPKNTPWDNASNVKYPLLTVSSIAFQARAYPAIVDGSNLVKGRVLGPDGGVPDVGPDGQPAMQAGPEGEPEPIWKTPPGEKRERADRVANHMTWQLLYRMPGWEEDTDRMLLMLPILGMVIRKTYFDPIAQTNVSSMITPEDFVINYWAKSLESSPRFTHILRYYPHEAREFIVTGIWNSVPTTSDPDNDKGDQADDNAQVRYYEQHRLIDLDEDGYPEPYIVTATTDGKIARIAACFTMKDVKFVQDKKTGEQFVASIRREEYFTKYGFIPSPDGSFYDIGFGLLLGDIGATIDTILNQMIDAASLANAQGGFLGSGVNIKSGNMRFRLGEWKRVDVMGGNLRENIVPLELPGPSTVMFQLLGLLIDAAKDITSVQDIMTGGPTTAQTATTTMAQVEQGMKSFNAIFKRIHRAFWRELKILFRLNGEFMDEEEYFALADTPGVIAKKDYLADDIDIMPVSDPMIATDMQRMARADYLMTFVGNPDVNQKEITRRRLEAGGVPDIKTLMDVPAAGPAPEVLIKGAELEIKKIIADADGHVKRSQASGNFADAATALAALGLLPDAATLAAEAVGESGNGKPTDQPGRVPEMAGPSRDEGLPGVPGQAPDGPGLSMGEGASGFERPGAAGAGGPDGPIAGPQF